MWVQQVHGKRLHKAIFKRYKNGNVDLTASAREAELHVDLENKAIKVHMHHGYVLNESGTGRAWFENQVWDVELPEKFGKQEQPKPRAMDWNQLLQRRQDLLQNFPQHAEQIAQAEKLASMQSSEHDAKHLENLRYARERDQLDLRCVDTELQMRPALCLGCLCFVLVGCPVGIWFSKSDYLSAFITCFLPIVFLYYPLLLCGTNLAKAGRIPPTLALWSANLVMALIAAALFRKLLRN
jgi:lipopolysaccharide export system permease protein